jgi:hypothetical protein
VTSVSLLLVMKLTTRNRGATVLVTCEKLLVAERPRLRDRLAARWSPRRLDRALASGTPPEAGAALALRARELTELSRRRTIARSFREVLREACEGARRSYGQVGPARASVVAASEELAVLADTLEAPGPVAAPGVAQAWMLLTDGTGPLYDPESRVSLRARTVAATQQLRAWPA